MKISYRVLKTLLIGKYTPTELIDSLNHLGFEVEHVINQQTIYDQFIIVNIQELGPHPNADNLQICEVFDGAQTLQIVCAAKNVVKGNNAVLAPIGAVMPKDPSFIIKEATIRGIKSYGMLCSAEELGIQSDNIEGIIVVDPTIEIGTTFGKYAELDDVIIDIAVTPNLSDAMSIYGVARYLKAIDLGKLRTYDQMVSAISNPIFDIYDLKPTGNIIIEDPCLCQYFSITCIEDLHYPINIKEITKYLENIDMLCDIPVVDIANYCMMVFGWPVHIYDTDKLDGKIYIRRAKDGETMKALNGKEYTLDPSITVVTDESKIISIAGIMGSDDTKVTKSTKNISIEIASFARENVAIASSKLKIFTESKVRFERGVDNSNTLFFVNYMILMILKYCGGNIEALSFEHSDNIHVVDGIMLDIKKIRSFVGQNDIEAEDFAEIIERLGFIVQDNIITVPSYRYNDVKNLEDVIEEYLKIKGLNIVTPSAMPFNLKLQKHIKRRLDSLREFMAAKHYMELISWSFASSKANKILGLKSEIELINPISQDLDVMRVSILEHLLKSIAASISKGNTNNSLFEIGKTYETQGEMMVFSGVKTGKLNERSVHKIERSTDFFDIKTDLYEALCFLGINTNKINIKTLEDNKNPSFFNQSQCIELYYNNQFIGTIGEISPIVLKQFEIEQQVFFFNVYLDKIPIKGAKTPGLFNPIHYQDVARDFAFIVDNKVMALDMINCIRNADKNCIKDVEIFDEYLNFNGEEDKKSLAFMVKMYTPSGTMREEQINEISNKIINAVNKAFAATLRAG